MHCEDPSLKKELSDLKDEWSTHFAYIEALLMGSSPLSAQPISALVFSLVKVKVTHPPLTGALSASLFLPHTVPPPPAGLAPGLGQESVLENEAPVDNQQPETSGYQPGHEQQPEIAGFLPGVLLPHWRICTRTGHRTQNQPLGHLAGNQSLMKTYGTTRFSV